MTRSVFGCKGFDGVLRRYEMVLFIDDLEGVEWENMLVVRNSYLFKCFLERIQDFTLES